MKFSFLSFLLILLISIVQSCSRAESSVSAVSALSSTFEGKVIAVKDGDTFVVLDDYNKQITVRLSDIDCPEKKQPFGTRAKQFASGLCFGKKVAVRKNANNDRYGRMIAEVFVDELCVNKELVSHGYAWHFIKFSTDTSYAALEKIARLNKVGLWIDSDATPPWEWRDHKHAAGSQPVNKENTESRKK